MKQLLTLPGGLKLNRKNIVPDLVAGATFAVVNVPQGMANAVLASVNPVAGLYALMIAMPIGAMFTSSVYMNVSTTGALSVAAGEALSDVPDQSKISALVTLVVLIGLAQLAMGVLKLGSLVRYISNSVMTGFITGIAALIILGAIPDITGYESPLPNHLLRIADTILNWRSLDYAAVVFGIATIAIIFYAQTTRVAKFALIVALVAVTAMVQLSMAVLSIGDTELVKDVAAIPRSLPDFVLPDLGYLPSLTLPAIAIAVIGLVQGAGVGQSYPNPDGRFPDASQDFVAQGVANTAAGFFGAIPSGGSMSGTAVNVQAGAKSRWANIFAGLIVIAIVFFFVGLVELVPMAALGGLLVVVGIQNVSPKNILIIWNTGTLPRIAMSVTFLATLLVPLQYAILLGIALSFVLQVMQASNRVEVRELELVANGFPIDKPRPYHLVADRVSILRVRGALFFASAKALEAQLPDASTGDRSVVILILRDVDDLGSTVIRLLQRYAQELEQTQSALMLAGVNDQLMRQLGRTGLLEQLSADNVYAEQDEIGAALNDAIQQANAWIDGNGESVG